MTHYGDITKLHGYDIEAVDVITGGSPCQDLSIAGRREGFGGERSVLFLDQIRLIKEMRERDKENGIRAAELQRPRYMVWENVPGAFSSRGGEDFKAVLEETVKVAEPEIPPLSVPEKGWPNAGLIYDELGGWSVAWRVHDARYWGVPQRRRRIALVADFAGLSAGEILFERKGLCRYSSEGEREESFAARRDCDGAGAEDRRNRLYDNHPQDSRITGPCDTANAVAAQYGTGGGNTPLVVHSYGIQGNTIDRKPHNGGNGSGFADEIVGTLNTMDRHATTYSLSKASFFTRQEKEQTNTLVATDWKDPVKIIEPKTLKERGGKPRGEKGPLVQDNLSATLSTFQDQTLFANDEVAGEPRYVARRITPVECERLQGYPDNWTDIGEWIDSKGKKRQTTDAMRYKALGNSIALPYWKVLARKIAAQYDRDITMGSLFDGIGGFPIAFRHAGATCLWTCEIDDFPKAVVKYHFGGEDAEVEDETH